jgi:hypothetical protein
MMVTRGGIAGISNEIFPTGSREILLTIFNAHDKRVSTFPVMVREAQQLPVDVLV